MKNVRVRIAPSPTGLLHIGTARTALFNYLFSKKENGVFVLRSEDTDLERSTKENEKDILEGLRWLGIDWDEGINKDGEYGPYRQTERKELYHQYLLDLIQTKKAYYCFCTKEELEEEKRNANEKGIAYKYSGKCVELSADEVVEKLKNKTPYVIRLRMPNKEVVFNDLIRGEVKNDLSLMGDIIIAKSVYEPLYNFAVVIDDYLMKISHVIRGEDHITNTAKQLAIYDAFGWDVPVFAHLPLILNKDKTKLSKRNNLVSILDYKKEGYLPEAIINFITLLGWHPKEDKEIISLKETVDEFSLDRVQKGGAVFDVDRLNFLNKYYILKYNIKKLIDKIIDLGIENKKVTKSEEGYSFLFSDNYNDSSEWYKCFSKEDLYNENKLFFKYINVMRSRINNLLDFLNPPFYVLENFFKDKKEYNNIGDLKYKNESSEDVKKSLEFSLNLLKYMNTDTLASIDNIKTYFLNAINNSEYKEKKGFILHPLRYAMAGTKKSESPWEIIYMLSEEYDGKINVSKLIKRVEDVLQEENN